MLKDPSFLRPLHGHYRLLSDLIYQSTLNSSPWLAFNNDSTLQKITTNYIAEHKEELELFKSQEAGDHELTIRALQKIVEPLEIDIVTLSVQEAVKIGRPLPLGIDETKNRKKTLVLILTHGNHYDLAEPQNDETGFELLSGLILSVTPNPEAPSKRRRIAVIEEGMERLNIHHP